MLVESPQMKDGCTKFSKEIALFKDMCQNKYKAHLQRSALHQKWI